MKIHVRIQDKSYEVQLGDIHARPIQAEVDGERFEVWPQELLVPGPEQAPTPPPQTAHPVKIIRPKHPLPASPFWRPSPVSLLKFVSRRAAKWSTGRNSSSWKP